MSPFEIEKYADHRILIAKWSDCYKWSEEEKVFVLQKEYSRFCGTIFNDEDYDKIIAFRNK